MIRPIPHALSICLSLTSFAAVASAQTPVGVVSGRVTTVTGAVVPRAELSLHRVDRRHVPDFPDFREDRSDRDGQFRIVGVPPGQYRLVASAPGWSAVVRDLTVEPNQTLDLGIVLPSVVDERVNVVGQASALDRIPGAGAVLTASELAPYAHGVADVHRMLRQVPGLTLQEEEGYGLRPNIGMRGSGSERSSKITLMEDGVLVAPAPYAAPAAYYFPTVARMEAIEVLKGASQVRFGPATTGGVLNLVSTPIPSAFRLRAGLAGGSDGLRKLTATLGDQRGRVGWLVQTYQVENDGFKELEGGGTGVQLEDYLAKLRFQSALSERGYQEIEVKLGRTEQVADETYLGLTDADFGATPLRRYAASREDRFVSTHTQYQVRHLYARGSWDITSTLYRNDFERAWYKLQDVNGRALDLVLSAPDVFAAELATLEGADSGPDALRVRNNNRTYYGAGAQVVLGVRSRTFGGRHDFQAGLRYHRDQEDRFQQDDRYRMVGGRMVLTAAGAPGSQDNRVGDARALAAFVMDTIRWGRLSATPGIRVERIDFRRTDYARTDPGRTGPASVQRNDLTAVIPGVGMTYEWSPQTTMFAGVHRGFAPPGPGSSDETEAERSVAYELGTRVRRGALRAEVVGFASVYANLLGRDTLSSGGDGTGDIFNAGSARVWGLEATAAWEVASRLAGPALRVPVRLVYTFTASEFRQAFDSQFEPWGRVRVGDAFPYVPRHQMFAEVAADYRDVSGSIEAVYVSQMRTVAGQGAYVEAESVDAHLVFSLSGRWRIRPDVSLTASMQNLTDARYAVSRHPAGLRPGLPRQVFLGLTFDIGRDGF